MDYKRLWLSAVAGMVFGFLVSVVVSWFTDMTISGFVMLPIIVGGSIGSFFILKNNKDFKK